MNKKMYITVFRQIQIFPLNLVPQKPVWKQYSYGIITRTTTIIIKTSCIVEKIIYNSIFFFYITEYTLMSVTWKVSKIR